MDFKEIIKLQVISQMGLGGLGGAGGAFGRGKAHGHGHGGAAAGTGALLEMFYQFILFIIISAMDDIIKVIPVLYKEAQSTIREYFKRRVSETLADAQRPKMLTDTSVTLTARHTVSSFRMMRIYDNKDSSAGNSSAGGETTSEETNGMVDAVLAHISKLENVPTFSLIDKGQIMAVYKDKPIQMTREIFCKIDAINFTNMGNVASIKFTLLSNALSASEISVYVKKLYQDYLQEMKNSLGSNIFFFDQKSRESTAPSLPASSNTADIINHKRMIISSAPKQLSFTMTPFYSNKRFSNIFGNEIREIEKRVRFFVEKREWYDSKGIPYQLGLLLSGIPGAGKTSVIRAIANLTKRHIVNVNFANITTATQLKNLFFSDKLQVFSDHTLSNSQSYFIPIQQRLYVLEEIDAIGDIVKQRRPSGAGGSESTAVNDELTLGEILTVLDGTMEVPGRMIVMTTNHPEVLDDALIRPGRIDVQAAFTYATRELIADMYIAYLEKELSPESVAQLPNAVLSPAEVGQVLFRHFGMPSTEDEIVADLVKTAGISFAKRLARSATVTAVAAVVEPAPAPAPVRAEPPAVTPAGAAPAPTVMPAKTWGAAWSKSDATSPVGATESPIKPVVARTHSAMEAAAKSKQLNALPMFSPEIETEMNDSGSALHFTSLDPDMEPVERYAPAI
jgi:AAA+ superfamily predicted ATPase